MKKKSRHISFIVLRFTLSNQKDYKILTSEVSSLIEQTFRRQL